MKRFLVLILAVAILLSITACGNKAEDDSASTNDSANTSTGVEVDENLITVDITLPASFFEDMTEEEIKEAAKESGTKDCVVNEDGTVTYTMTKKAHKELLENLKAECDNTILGLLEGENKVDSFVSIDYNDELSEFNVYVDSATYNTFENLYALGFFFTGAYYQAFAGVESDDVDIIVNFIDNETKEALHTTSYKEYLENSEE